jgi:hypothetical protein
VDGDRSRRSLSLISQKYFQKNNNNRQGGKSCGALRLHNFKLRRELSRLNLEENEINCNFPPLPSDADDVDGCGSGECGDGQSCLAAAERSALVGRRRFSLAAGFAGASCGIAVAASCSEMAGAGAALDAGDWAAWECGEIDGWRRCR